MMFLPGFQFFDFLVVADNFRKGGSRTFERQMSSLGRTIICLRIQCWRYPLPHWQVVMQGFAKGLMGHGVIAEWISLKIC